MSLSIHRLTLEFVNALSKSIDRDGVQHNVFTFSVNCGHDNRKIYVQFK